MSMVNITPMSPALRAIPKRWRPHHPPIFDGSPTRADVAIAIELLEALDSESFAWYGGDRAIAQLRARLADA